MKNEESTWQPNATGLNARTQKYKWIFTGVAYRPAPKTSPNAVIQPKKYEKKCQQNT